MGDPEQSGVEHHVNRPKGPLDLEIRQRVLSRDDRYALGAYLFLYEALQYTQRSLGRDDAGLPARRRHVSGRELLAGIREHAAEQFGPLAPTVFRSWGMKTSADFGDIVFNLVESELLGKTDDDRREDFAGGFDMDTAFEGLPKVRLE